MPVAELICGGGIAVAEGFDDPHPLELEPLAAALAARTGNLGVRLMLEPGRALIARAGTSLYRIMAVKVPPSTVVRVALPPPALIAALMSATVIRPATTW